MGSHLLTTINKKLDDRDQYRESVLMVECGYRFVVAAQCISCRDLGKQPIFEGCMVASVRAPGESARTATGMVDLHVGVTKC